MDSALELRIRKSLNEELIRRLLKKYFYAKGFEEKLDKKLHPPAIQDLPALIPQMRDKVEILPFVEDLNPLTGKVKIGWNLFVLGNKRMYLGESTHKSMNELKIATCGPIDRGTVVQNSSPRKIIEFITKALGDSKRGFLDPKSTMPNASSPLAGNSGQFYGGSQGFEKNRAVY